MRDVGGARIEPWLVSEMRVEEGGRKYRFRLRRDVRFHDGRRLSARNVRYSLERLLQHHESTGRWFYAPIRGARALLDGTAGNLEGFEIHSSTDFTITLEQPLSFFPVLLACAIFSIVPEGTGRIGDSIREGAVGTGPFRVIAFEPGSRLELERNPYYWRKGYPKSDRLLFSFGLQPERILAEYRAGRFSLAADLYPADVEALRRDPALAAGYREMPRLSTYYLAFNLHRSRNGDPDARRRIVAAADVARVVRQTLGALALPAHGIIPPGLPGHDPRSGSSESTRATVSARDATSKPLELTAALHPVYAGELSKFTQELLRTLRSAGVKVTVESDTMVRFREARERRTTDVVLGRWIADYPDADTFAYILHTTDGHLGRVCGTAAVDGLIALGRAETDPSVRHAIYRQIEDTIAREALLLPLFHEQVYRFARPEVEGLSLSYWQPAVAYEELSVRIR